MSMPTPKSLSDFQSDFLSSWNAYVGNPPGTVIPESDPFVAIGAANSGAALYLQGLVYDLVGVSRASTSVGSDLDSWLADFGYTRAPGAPAQVTLSLTVNPSLANPPGTVTIPKDTIFQTGSIVVSPAALPAVYSVATNAEVVVTTSGVVQVPCTANAAVTVSGETGFEVYNQIPPGAITVQYEPIAGVVSVTNSASPTGGTNSASDPQARADFVDYINSLAESNFQGVKAGIEDVFGSLQLGVNFQLLTNSTAPTRVQPGLLMAVFISPGNNGQYTGSPVDPNAQAILNSMEASQAFGLTPVVYYATQHQITAISVPYTYSASALNRAGLSVSALQQIMSQTIAGFIPKTGGALGQVVFFSALAAALLNISVTLPTGVVGGIVTDVYVGGLSFTASPGGVFDGGDFVQPGTPAAIDQLGYLSWDPSTYPATFTATAAA